MDVVSSVLGFQQREQGDSYADLQAFLSTHSRGLCPFHVNPLRDCLSHLFPQETLDDMQRHLEARC